MTIKKTSRNLLCSVLVVLQITTFPSFALAQEAAPESSSNSASTSGSSETPAPPAEAPAESNPPAPAPQPDRGATNTGPTSPTGADAKTYKQNPDGTWSNDKYTWDPNTKQSKPVNAPTYSYNPTTGMWDTTEYVYSPEQGKYIPNTRSSASNPAAIAQANRAGAPSNFSISNTGPNSNNGINNSSNTTGNFDLFFNGAISNTINSNAQSGDALVQGNTMGGDALSGDAAAIANLLNMLQSSWLGSSDIATFVNTVDGDVYGDLLIDPNALAYGVGSNNSDIDVNISNNGVINNDINLNAQSGDATVDGNTNGGNATSGDARAMANVINMINSAVNAGKSFLGMVNITGNFDGDILLPPGVLEALIASTGPNSTNTIGGTTNTDIDVNSTTNRTINNNIDTDATSGNATVSGNTSAGSATTGAANTGVNTMNIVGQDIKAKNGLLVFVNVMGRWVGMVVGPAATTATITNTGPGSTNNIGPGNSNQSLSVESTENSLINNNINLATQSGDATVSNNTSAGNATTGDTQSSVNLLNIIGSNINVEDWFGVLFINVFGNWFGNFGEDSANGGFSQSAGGVGGAPSETAAAAAPSGPVGQLLAFVTPSDRNTDTQFNAVADASTTVDGQTTNTGGTVFGGNTTPGDTGAGETSSAVSAAETEMNWWLIAGVIGLISTILVLAREYMLALQEERNLVTGP